MARRRPRFLVPMLIAVAALIALGAAPARATFPGPNGRIAFSDYTTGKISAVNPDGSALVQLTHLGANRAADDPSWSANGKRLLFDVFANAPPRIWVVHADGSHQRKVADDANGFGDLDPAYTPDAHRIVFVRCQPDDGVCAIWKMRADGTHKRALTPFIHSSTNEANDFNPTVSPNGKRIAFSRFQAGGFASRVFVMHSDGSNPHPITPPWIEGGHPDWSPTGHRIVFNSNVPRPGSSLFKIKPDGSHIHRITPDRYPHSDALPSYSPRGNRIAFISDRNYSDVCCNDLFAINPDGTGEQMIDTGLSGAGILNPAWGTAPKLP